MKCKNCGKDIFIITKTEVLDRNYVTKFYSKCCGIELEIGNPRSARESRPSFECHRHMFNKGQVK